MFSIPQGPRRLLIALAAMTWAALPAVGGVEPCLGESPTAPWRHRLAETSIDDCRAGELHRDIPTEGCSCRAERPKAAMPPTNPGLPRGPNPSRIAATAFAPAPPVFSARGGSIDGFAGVSLYLWISRLLT